MNSSVRSTLKFAKVEKELSLEFSPRDLWWEWLLAFIGTVSFINLLCVIFSIKNTYLIVLGAAFLSIGIQFLYSYGGKIRILSFGILLFGILAALLVYTKILGGFYITINQVLDTFGNCFGKIMPIFSVPVLKEEYVLSQMLFIGILTFIMAYPITFSSKNKEIIIPTICSCILLVLCGVLKCQVQPILLIFWSIFVLGIVIGKICANKRITFILGGATGIICILSVVIFSLTGFIDNYEGMNIFSSAKSSMDNLVHNARYQGTNIMPEGDFRNLKPFHPTEKEQLEIVMNKPDSLYLRGFVGSKYNGRGWDNISNSKLFESKDLFYWLHEEGFYGQTQIANLVQSVDSSITNDKHNQISIRNIGANSKYIYSPYELVDGGSISLPEDNIGDENILANGFKGNRYYKYTALLNQVKSYTTLSQKLNSQLRSNEKDIESYINSEEHYNEFVYDTYLDMPENIRNLLKNHLGDYNLEGNTHLNYYNAKQNILSYLTTKLSYSTDVHFTDNGNDFLQNFLEGSCEGYSVHYATAATLMFRYYKIPARYVEGFVITPDDVKGVLANSAISIDETHAHAWVEFYQDGVGWIPFEVTPPYLNIMEKDDELSGLPNMDYEESNIEQNDNGNNEQDVNEGISEMDKMKHFSFVLNVMKFTLGLIILILLALIMIVLYKRLKLKRRLKTFESSDIQESIIQIFSYIADMMIVTGVIKDENEIYEVDISLREWLKDDTSDFQKALQIYEEARYSRHEMNSLQRQYLIDTKDKIQKKIRYNAKFFRNLKYRLVNCIY